jgi:predicted regulator of Ras-like GTPase activity (Roadblock/LC7/MglB family)
MTGDGEDLGAVIGAHLSGVSDEAARAMRHFGLGAWTRIAIETEAATVVMAPTGEGVTLVAAPREVPLGLARRTLDQCVNAATSWLGGGA